ncbi:MAG: ATP-binding protein, partial [bacterium]
GAIITLTMVLSTILCIVGLITATYIYSYHNKIDETKKYVESICESYSGMLISDLQLGDLSSNIHQMKTIKLEKPISFLGLIKGKSNVILSFRNEEDVVPSSYIQNMIDYSDYKQGWQHIIIDGKEKLVYFYSVRSSLQNVNLAWLTMYVDKAQILSVILNSTIHLAALGFMILVVVLFVFWLMLKVVLKPFTELALEIENPDKMFSNRLMTIFGPHEVMIIKSAVLQLKKHLEDKAKYETEIAKNEAMINSASQVAHDIRSPLAALNMVTHDLKQLPEEERVIIRSAVQRIQDIANDLASKKDQSSDKTQDMKQQTKDQGPKEMKIKLLSSLVEQMVSEKRTEFRSRSGINIVSNLGAASYGLFANIHSREFKRILSNLINNAAEAMDGNGNITVSMLSRTYDPTIQRSDESDKLTSEHRGIGASAQLISIAITDNGKGIPEDIIPKLMQKGASFGKEGHKKSGSGLGLYHARETVESWGGNINIESQLGEGTTITITIPKQQAPDWFVPEINIASDTFVFILDDDDSIHQVWQNRFNTAKMPKEKIHHFTSNESIINFYREKAPLLKKAEKLFLFDYELLGSDKTGLQVIKELNIKENAILVTSHYEEEHIRSECARLGVKLLPKNLAGFVPISVIGCRLSVVVEEKNTDSGQLTMDNDKDGGRLSVVEKDEYTITENLEPKTDQNCDAILIDDDYLVHTSWKIIAKRYGKTIRCYADPADFISDSK